MQYFYNYDPYRKREKIINFAECYYSLRLFLSDVNIWILITSRHKEKTINKQDQINSNCVDLIKWSVIADQWNSLLIFFWWTMAFLFHYKFHYNDFMFYNFCLDFNPGILFSILLRFVWCLFFFFHWRVIKNSWRWAKINLMALIHIFVNGC